MNNRSDSGNSGERDMPIDATFVDGFDVDEEEDRWASPTHSIGTRIHRHKRGEYRGR